MKAADPENTGDDPGDLQFSIEYPETGWNREVN